MSISWRQLHSRSWAEMQRFGYGCSEYYQGFFHTYHYHHRETEQWIPVGDCWCLLCLSLCLSESWSCRGRAQPQTSPRRSRRQSLPWVLALTCSHTVIRCVWGIIDHCFQVQLSSSCLKTSLLSYSILVLLPLPFLLLLLLLVFLPRLPCRFCWCRSLWGES